MTKAEQAIVNFAVGAGWSKEYAKYVAPILVKIVQENS